MANGPEASPPGARVPTPQLTIFGLMVKLETWWATESSVYIPTPVPGMAASSPRRLAAAGRERRPGGPVGPTTAAGPTAAARARAGTTRRRALGTHRGRSGPRRPGGRRDHRRPPGGHRPLPPPGQLHPHRPRLGMSAPELGLGGRIEGVGGDPALEVAVRRAGLAALIGGSC